MWILASYLKSYRKGIDTMDYGNFMPPGGYYLSEGYYPPNVQNPYGQVPYVMPVSVAHILPLDQLVLVGHLKKLEPSNKSTSEKP